MSTLFRHVCYQFLVMCQKDQLFVDVLANLSIFCDLNLSFDSERILTNFPDSKFWTTIKLCVKVILHDIMVLLQ